MKQYFTTRADDDFVAETSNRCSRSARNPILNEDTSTLPEFYHLLEHDEGPVRVSMVCTNNKQAIACRRMYGKDPFVQCGPQSLGYWQAVLQAVPDRSLHDEIRKTLLDVDSVSDVHHQHLWSRDGEHHVLTPHVVINRNVNANEYGFIKSTTAKALEKYGLAHTTIEVECSEEFCRDGTPE